MRIITLSLLSTLLAAACLAQAPFPGTATQWQGFTRYDFPLAAPEPRAHGSQDPETASARLDGCCFHRDRTVTVVTPTKPAPGTPWLWRGEFFGAFATVDTALLKLGWHVVYLAAPNTFGSPDTMNRWASLYDELTLRHGFSPKPVLLGMSRGGLYVYNWAAAHPDKAGLIYGDAPVCDVNSWPGGKSPSKSKGSPKDWDLFKQVYNLTEQQALQWKGNPVDILAPIAKAHIPIIHVYGDADDVVPHDENTLVLKQRYEALGGHVELIAKPGVGHHPHSLEDPTPIVDYILAHRLQ